MKGTWREGSLAADPEGYVEKALQTGISFHRSPTREPGRELAYWDFERWMTGGCIDGVLLSEDVQWRGPRGKAPLLGTLEDMLIKAPDTGISPHRGPFTADGNLES